MVLHDHQLFCNLAHVRETPSQVRASFKVCPAIVSQESSEHDFNLPINVSANRWYWTGPIPEQLESCHAHFKKCRAGDAIALSRNTLRSRAGF